MKTLVLAAAVVTAFGLSTMTVAPAMARDTFSFSFDAGNVAFAYSDGYWDRDRKWHKWRNSREAREYRNRHGGNYTHRRHAREANMGWRGDQDRDGVPNRYDRDRDGDGINNRRDDAPSNPRRN